MPRIAVPNIFVDGKAPTGAQLDANFAAFTTLVNTTKLDKDNFRKTFAVGNDRKRYPYAPAPRVISIRQITQGPFLTRSYRGLYAPTHYAQYPKGAASSDGLVAPEVEYKGSGGIPDFTLDALQGCYHGATGLQAGDILRLYATYRTRLAIQPGQAILDIKSDNVLQRLATPAAAPLDYLELSVLLATDATAGTRTVNGIVGIAFLKIPHVR